MTRKPVTGRRLSLAEREEIAVLFAAGQSRAQIGRVLGRDRSTIGRELTRNQSDPRPGRRVRRYRALHAQAQADARARRPQVRKLVGCDELAAFVVAGLQQDWSPRQIQGRLAEAFCDRPEMRVSHETIYQSLFVQTRGGLARELTGHLRTGRSLRKPRARARAEAASKTTGPIPGPIPISARPAEAADRAVPGHWEGDLIVGQDSKSAIGTLVERTTRFTILLHLPADHTAPTVRDAMIPAIQALPEHLRRSLAWDRGSEMALHRDITLATDLDIYFCDPHSPWQRGSNENTNGLLRQYFPKGSDLSIHTPHHLATIAAKLNSRPRQTLGWATPHEKLTELLNSPQNPPVATTT
ncbi:IS30 family transposase [Cryptosporangium phraense]|uniref:IS30 family transposase n=1 Tax=Cryptosporangium phraense TaxID=2593070 RepID=A0A545ADT3_9ACTN|nr:IS30 family transposase [Cryptosporangium phraense]TQS39482.1 IS30 family transposase [Cryptosporangium phraense]